MKHVPNMEVEFVPLPEITRVDGRNEEKLPEFEKEIENMKMQ